LSQLDRDVYVLVIVQQPSVVPLPPKSVSCIISPVVRVNPSKATSLTIPAFVWLGHFCIVAYPTVGATGVGSSWPAHPPVTHPWGLPLASMYLMLWFVPSLKAYHPAVNAGDEEPAALE